MPLKIVQENIVNIHADAIVNSTNSRLIGMSGADLAIHQGAGERMEEACRGLNHLGPGEVKVTKGYELNCRYVLHTKVPFYQEDDPVCIQVLKDCYQNALNQALGLELESIAFPIIGAGHMGYPKGMALSTAIDVIRGFLAENDLLIYLVIRDPQEFEPCGPIFDLLDEYLNQGDDESSPVSWADVWENEALATIKFDETLLIDKCLAPEAPSPKAASGRKKRSKEEPLCAPSLRAPIPGRLEKSCYLEEWDLDELVNQQEETFQEMLFRLIDKKQLSGAACYKRANIDRRLYSKIQCDREYHPTKKTALAFSLALELSLEETEHLLMKAGYAFSNASRSDQIIRFFIKNRHYDILDINQALFKYDQPLFG